MKQNTFKPRGGAIIILCIAVAALWLTAVYGTYEDSQREKYSVTIKPGEVVYGTHSSAVVPMTVTTTRPGSTVPMVSASAVRSYAHHGHATMPAASQSSGYTMHTTSSATVHTIGSGGAGGGGMSAGGSSASQRGVVYGSPSIALPTLAMATQSHASNISANEPVHRSVGPKRMPGYTLDEEDEGTEQYIDGEGMWYWNGEEWILGTPEGATKIEGGITYQYIGGAWVPVGDQGDPGLPVGPTPWLMMMALGAIYALRKRIRGLVG